MFFERYFFNLKLFFTWQVWLMLKINKALKAIDNENYHTALEVINSWLLDTPKENELLSLKWFCLKRIWKTKEALNIYEYAFKLKPEDKSLTWEIWEILLLLWNSIAAIKLLEECVESKYKWPYPLYLLALAYINTFQIQKAEDTVDKLVKYKLKWDDLKNLETLKVTLEEAKEKLKKPRN